MPSSGQEGTENQAQVRENLNIGPPESRKTPSKKKAERDYYNNVTAGKDRCIKQQTLGVLAFGSIIGLEEAVLTGSECYTTTVTCKSTQPYKNKEKSNLPVSGKAKKGGPQKAIIYVMKADVFKSKV
jgi:hypothetical protein